MTAQPRPVLPEGYEGPLAEYTALTGEIVARIERANATTTLQITTVGAIFAYALSGPGRLYVLYIVPFSSVLILSRLLLQNDAIAHLGRYIREELSDRVPGGLGWQEWRHTHPLRLSLPRWLSPLFLGFPGVAALALAWSAHTTFVAVFGSGSSPWGVGIAWLSGVLATVWLFFLVNREVKIWPPIAYVEWQRRRAAASALRSRLAKFRSVLRSGTKEAGPPDEA